MLVITATSGVVSYVVLAELVGEYRNTAQETTEETSLLADLSFVIEGEHIAAQATLDSSREFGIACA